jgi:hypothetical protein
MDRPRYQIGVAGPPPPWHDANPMPHNLCQWLAYIAAVALGIFVSWGTQQVFMRKILNLTNLSEKLRSRIAIKTGEPAIEETQLPIREMETGLSDWVGAMEIVLYASAVVYNYPSFIAAWFATKFVASHKTWAPEPFGRTFYNRALFGSGLNILLGFFTGKMALWAIWYVGIHQR